MGVNINGGMNIGNGGILISAPYIIPNDYIGPICVSGAGEANGTYTFGGYYTQNGFTRPYYNSPTSRFQISVAYTGGGSYGLWDGSGNGNLLYETNNLPPASNPYLEPSWDFAGTFDPAPITVTIGPC